MCSCDSAARNYPTCTRHWPNVVLMLARRLRRRPSIKTTLGHNQTVWYCDSAARNYPTCTRHWPNVILMSARRLRRRPNIKTTSGHNQTVWYCDSAARNYPTCTRHWPNVILMLARRLRRRPNIKTTLGQCLVLAGYLPHWTHTLPHGVADSNRLSLCLYDNPLLRDVSSSLITKSL